MTQRDETATWRLNVLEAMLNALTVAGPAVFLITVFLRKPIRFDAPFYLVGSAVIGVVVLKFVRPFSFRVRAGLTVALILYGCLAWISLTGFSMGGTAGIVGAIVISVLLLGRRVALTLLGFAAIVVTMAGLSIQMGWTNPTLSDSDPRIFANWFRMGWSMAILTGALAVAVEYVVTQIEAKYAELSAAYDELGELHKKLETAKEEERRFIASELHDDLGQALTVLKLGLKTGRSSPFSDPVRVVDGLIVKVRELSRTLRPSLLDEVGLAPALSAYLEEQSTISGLAMALDAQRFEGRVPGDLEIACFRLVQEAVTNALRHADAEHLTVTLERNADFLKLCVKDDGKGFAGVETLVGAALEGHIGIVGMRERVRTLGGAFRIRSKTGVGTAIEVELPLTASARSASRSSRGQML